jgi:septum formation protein
MHIVLASSSPYRRQLLGRLGLDFAVHSPDVDETPRVREAPDALVARLSEAKARAAATRHRHSLIIGSDQAAIAESTILAKPGSASAAIAQLESLRGRTVTFYTGLCLLNAANANVHVAVETVRVTYRNLGTAALARYVARDEPHDCVGAFKSEGYGIALCSAITCDDPTALVGLPLIRLVAMLAKEGIEVP